MLRFSAYAFPLLCCIVSLASPVPSVPGLPVATVVVPGQLMIGALVSITGDEVNKWTGKCEDSFAFKRVEFMQKLLEVVDQANANSSSIFNGIRLGLTIYDFCVRDMYAIAQGLNFLPTTESSETRYVVIFCCLSSAVTARVSSLTSAYEIPQISTSATSTILSDKRNHEFFLRTALPDTYLVDAVISIAAHYRWSYVAVIYTEGLFGETLFHRFEELSRQQFPHLCIGYSAMILQTRTAETMPQVVDQLMALADINVVVLFVYDPQLFLILQEMKRRNIPNRFIWLDTAAFWFTTYQRYSLDLEDTAPETLMMLPSGSNNNGLYKFLSDPAAFAEDPRNPWLTKYWEGRYNCRWNVTCNVTSIPSDDRQPLTNYGAQLNDALQVVVSGLQDYLPTIDYNLTRYSSRDYLHAMKSVRFEGKSGPIQFDQNGDLQGVFTILHAVPRTKGYQIAPVGKWSAVDGSLTLDGSIAWHGPPGTPVRESICSQPCGPGYVKIPRELICCWSCFRCRNNQIPNANASLCVDCPKFTWPDDSLLTCVPITPTFVHASESLGISLLSVSAIGTVFTLTIVAVFVRFNHNHLIRSSCREASFLLLFGIALDFLLLILLTGQPTDTTCFAFRFGFHLSSTLIYAAITIKITKIFRIFRAGRKSTQAPKFISPLVQTAVIAGLVAVEALVIGVSVLIERPSADLFMASRDEPVVELTCTESVLSMCMGLAVNLVLIVCCTCLAFLSRKLPENYNESSQVAFSVVTTLLLWVVFVPSWLASSSASSKVMMIGIALIVNGFVNLFSLFFPKVYVLYRADTHSTRPSRVTGRQFHPSAASNTTS